MKMTRETHRRQISLFGLFSIEAMVREIRHFASNNTYIDSTFEAYVDCSDEWVPCNTLEAGFEFIVEMAKSSANVGGFANCY